MNKALIVVDVQNDFLPGGALAVPRGDEVITPILRLYDEEDYDTIVFTQDWHPYNHISFAATHNEDEFTEIDINGHTQMLWPRHCIRWEEGSEITRELEPFFADMIIRKGTDPDTDSYSAVCSNINPYTGKSYMTGLSGYLRDRAVREVDVCGLAFDYCVKYTAMDLAVDGFITNVLLEATRAVTPENNEQTKKELTDNNVRIIDERA